MEIIDGQFHEPSPPKPVGDQVDAATSLLINVELAREAIDCVGVDRALAFASQPYIDACVARYPERFAGVVVFDHLADDLEEQIAAYRSRPGCLAGRNMVGNYATAELRPEFREGAFDRYWAYAEKHDLPLFFSTHGWASEMSLVAERHPRIKGVQGYSGGRSAGRRLEDSAKTHNCLVTRFGRIPRVNLGRYKDRLGETTGFALAGAGR